MILFLWESEQSKIKIYVIQLEQHFQEHPITRRIAKQKVLTQLVEMLSHASFTMHIHSFNVALTGKKVEDFGRVPCPCHALALCEFYFNEILLSLLLVSLVL